MTSIFTYRDDTEGKIGIGKLPNELQTVLDDISTEYYNMIPDKNVSTHHIWYKDMPSHIKTKVQAIQKNEFWNKLCDGSNKCIKNSANEMDELYYSNPKHNLNKINLYGATSNYDIHKDCFFSFNGIRFYRILIGLTDGNDNVTTYFNHFDAGHKLNSGDYIVFDFDKSTHQVIKGNEKKTPRILLKLHYIVCEECSYTKDYVAAIKQMYLWYECITRYVMKTGTDPETFYGFFCGLLCQYYMNDYTVYVLLAYVLILIAVIRYALKVKFIYKNISKFINYIVVSVLIGYLLVVTGYWLRYKLFGIR
jgi:hypothetical protein